MRMGMGLARGARRVFAAVLFFLFPFIVFSLLAGCPSSPSEAGPEDGAAGLSAGGDAGAGGEGSFVLPGLGSDFVFAVSNPSIFWEPQPGGGEIQVQVSRSAEFAEGTILLDARTAASGLRLGLGLEESSAFFLRARPVGFFGGDWGPAVRISYKPLDIAMRQVKDCEMAVYEMTNGLLAEIVNRLLPGGEISVSGGMLRGKDGTPYLGLGELNYGFQFGLELLQEEDRPGVYALAPKAGRGEHPAVGLSWYGAAFICDSLSRMFGYRPAYARIAPGVTADAEGGGFRMPAEAEWDYAARGPDAFAYPGGAKTLDPRSANYLRSGDPFESLGRDSVSAGGPTSPAGFYDGMEKDGYKTVNGVSPLGLHDMLGNVWEWCDDVFAGEGENAAEGEAPQDAGRFRVVRGGAWNTRRADLSLGSRGWYKAEGFSYSLGLRLARKKEFTTDSTDGGGKE
ncbi:MAG: formylglycine-generating enzyme family protein [Spirochaetia bacterium]|jgi:formylglycine-generating enzyme required for sulfatase activity|nr:formylglycine-generating enzyme family protein [Spirochaetia bacterium]